MKKVKKAIREEAFKHHPTLQGWKKAILFLPILLSISSIFYLRNSQNILAYYGAEQFAPANTAPLMIALVLFTVGYVIFLLMMFSENIKEFFKKKSIH